MSTYIPLISFTGGFIWDSFTLTRIDRMSDNMILLGYLFLLGSSILILNLVEHNLIRNSLILRFRKFYPLGIQFFLGGLFSSYVVFYFQSASVTKTWLFLGILFCLLISNEFLEKRLTNIYLQFSLYFLVIYSFMIFFLPVLLEKMNWLIFILSGLVTLAVMTGYLYLFIRKWVLLKKRQYRRIGGIVLTLYVTINVFYFLNWIPPVPLSLKFGGIFHHVERIEGDFILTYEEPPWYNFWKKSENPYYHTGSDPVYCFTAVFAPVNLQKKIFHVWQLRSAGREKWLITDRLGFELTGGRKEGFRGYTFKKNVQPGDWRVDVRTDEDQILGRINFKIIAADSLSRPFTQRVY